MTGAVRSDALPTQLETAMVVTVEVVVLAVVAVAGKERKRNVRSAAAFTDPRMHAGRSVVPAVCGTITVPRAHAGKTPSAV